MLTEKEWQLFLDSMKKATGAYIFPFDWNAKTNQLTLTTSHWKKWFCDLLLALHFLLFSVLAIKLTEYSAEGLGTISAELSLHVLVTSIHLFCFAMGFGITGRQEELITLVNQMSRWRPRKEKSTNGRGRKLSTPAPASRKCQTQEWILLNFVCSLKPSIIPGSLVIVYCWDARFHLHALLPGITLSVAPKLCLFAISCCVIVFTLFQACEYTIFTICAGYTYAKTTSHFLDEATRNCGAEAETNQAIKTYKWLTIVNRLFNLTFGQALIPAVKLNTDLFGPVTMFISIRHIEDVFHAPVYLFMCFVGFVSMVLSCGPVFVLSSTNQKSIVFKNALSVSSSRRCSADSAERHLLDRKSVV